MFNTKKHFELEFRGLPFWLTFFANGRDVQCSHIIFKFTNTRPRFSPVWNFERHRKRVVPSDGDCSFVRRYRFDPITLCFRCDERHSFRIFVPPTADVLRVHVFSLRSCEYVSSYFYVWIINTPPWWLIISLGVYRGFSTRMCSTAEVKNNNALFVVIERKKNYTLDIGVYNLYKLRIHRLHINHVRARGIYVLNAL